jgi:hypothetical protein
MNEHVKIQKEFELSKGHSLSEECIWMDKLENIKNPSKGYSHPGEHRWADKSGDGENLSEQGALTDWREHKWMDKLEHRKY